MEYPSYTYDVGALGAGASFGNRYAFARLDARTSLLGLWSASDNAFYLGRWDIAFEADGVPLTAKTTRFFPESQSTLWRGRRCTAECRFLLPYLKDNRSDLLRTMMMIVTLRNESDRPADVTIRHHLVIPPFSSPLFTKNPPDTQAEKRFIITRSARGTEIVTAGAPNEVRIFASVDVPDLMISDEKELKQTYRRTLLPYETAVLPFTVAFSPEGIEHVRAVLERLPAWEQLYAESVAACTELLHTSEIVCPRPLINRGLQWAKLNTVRVQHQYRTGAAFTNDPPQDIVVVRDVAWYMFGSDYLTPGFSAELVEYCRRFGFHENGKLTEYLHANEDAPEQNDYKLNINDDTPLFVIALHHHAATTGGIERLHEYFPMMTRACDYILSQMEDGLVRCHADGTNVWGICSWRNIIDGYNLTGAVTEINVECMRALEVTAEAAEKAGHSVLHRKYADAAAALKAQINIRLLSEKTGLYVLNIGDDGVRHHDITGDLVFPLLFRAAGDEMQHRILRELTSPALWTLFGSRSVKPGEPLYDPDFGYQLVGGVWPNLTAWTAYCAGREQPAKLAEGMENIYAISEVERPVELEHVVPGEFPERLHGETYHSRGMTMSPWMPPTYLWLGVEGLCGVTPRMDGLEVNPVLPPEWRWLFLRNMPYRGASVTAVFFEGTIYVSHPVRSAFPVRVLQTMDVSAARLTTTVAAFASDTEYFLFAVSPVECAEELTLHCPGGEVRCEIRLKPDEAVIIRIPLEVTRA